MTPKIKYSLMTLSVVAGFLVMRIGFLLKDNLTSATANIETIANTQPPGPPTLNALTRDSDQDGISDRDEIVYGSDFQTPDTDGDGFLDGEEITSGHDPLDSFSNLKTSPANPYANKEPNLSDKMANLMVATMLGDDGQFVTTDEYDAGNVEKIVSDLKVAAALSLYVEPVQEIELRISDDNGSEAILKYLKTVTPMIEEGILSPMNMPGIGLTGTAGLSDYYQKTYQSLFSAEVPSSWKDIHMSLLNTLGQIIKTSESLTTEKIIADPIKATFALQQIQGVFNNFRGLLTQATQLAKEQNISTQDTIFEILKN